MLFQSLPHHSPALEPSADSVTDLLQRAADEQVLTPQQALRLLTVQNGSDLLALRQVAQDLAQRQGGPEVTYTTGRSLFLTNVCELRPVLYPYPKRPEQPGAWIASVDTVDQLLEAARRESVQWITLSGGGFHTGLVIPGLEAPTVLKTYLRVLERIQDRVPESWLCGFSPDEIAFLALVSDRSEAYILDCLLDYGLRRLEGFGTGLLLDRHRARLSPKKLTVKQWLDIVALAHQRGVPVVARLEASQLESWEQRLEHLYLLKAFQEHYPGAFCQLVVQAWPYPPVEPVTGPCGGFTQERDFHKLMAVARLVLGPLLPELQLAWVPDRLAMTQGAFEWGSRHAGGTHDLAYAHFLRDECSQPAWTETELRRLIQEAGYSPLLQR